MTARRRTVEAILLLICMAPVLATLVLAFFIGHEMIYNASADAKAAAEMLSIFGGSFLAGIGLAALAFTMAGVVDRVKDATEWRGLMLAGSFLSLGSLFFLSSLIVRFASLRYNDPEWWAGVGVDEKRAAEFIGLGFVLVPYEAGCLVAILGLLMMVYALNRWLAQNL